MPFITSKYSLTASLSASDNSMLLITFTKSSKSPTSMFTKSAPLCLSFIVFFCRTNVRNNYVKYYSIAFNYVQCDKIFLNFIKHN